MSYILDALKRADAERERGRVPGLHAHPLGEGGAEERAGRAPRWALWTGIAVGAVVLAALAWRMGADANAPLPVPMLPPAEPVPENIATPPTPAPPPPATAAAAEPTPRPAPNEADTEVLSYAPAPAEVRAGKVRLAAAEAGKPAPAAALVAAAPASAAAPARLPLVGELPASLRKQLPALAVGGSVYSDDAASRFIVLDGEVAKEGSQPAPGLVLERIEPRSAVLRFNGERFRLPF